MTFGECTFANVALLRAAGREYPATAMVKRIISIADLLGAAAALVVAVTSPANASSVDEGRNLAQRLCATCHGIERADRSPLPVAPAFRRMEPQVDLDGLVDRLQGGVIAGHPEMPAFVLREDEARALIAYMRSLQHN